MGLEIQQAMWTFFCLSCRRMITKRRPVDVWPNRTCFRCNAKKLRLISVRTEIAREEEPL